jgi:V8-like Glu-specific endopeptidase
MCNPSRTENLPSEDLVRMEKYIEIFSSYAYTRQISAKEPFTKKVRKAMTEDVKTLAHTNVLGKSDHKRGGNDGKFANGDEQILNFARTEASKNVSVQKPARLNQTLASYMRSIGQIKCGRVKGTCFLVTKELILTNYHVFRMIKEERNYLQNPNLPITVSFDYLYPEQTEHVLTVEVDEERDPQLENPYLDYKFLRLKQNENLNDRVSLGPIVRNWQLSDGRVIILGHPVGKEMQEEVCVVVGYRAMHETLRKRHELFTGVHMTNAAHLLHGTGVNQSLLPYDTSLFSGASGSPVFEMNGNIVAMHTQGYLLTRNEGNIPNQQENVENQEQDNVPTQGNTRTYSLMEFGIQFIWICEDMRRLHGENVVKDIFPNYKLNPGEESMDSI